MLDFLVGYTGFVGSNLSESHLFSGLFHSRNIEDAYGKKPDLLIYSGIRSEMYLANQNPEEDFRNIEQAIDNIRRIQAKQVVLVSTAAVYDLPAQANEDTMINVQRLKPYGANRYYLEEWVRANIKNHLIVRLPALYGRNIKKNFIYDLIYVIPQAINGEKFDELCGIEPGLSQFYIKSTDSFYRRRPLDTGEYEWLVDFFKRAGFTAMSFTDSRSQYQFYNLNYLWRYIEIALSKGLQLLNIVSEPVSAAEVCAAVTGENFINELQGPPYSYQIRTKYAELFHGKNGYMLDKGEVLRDLCDFIREQKGNIAKSGKI